MKAEARWTRVGDTWGVEIQQGMKTRDLPEWFAPCFAQGYGGLPPLCFERGAFVWLVWTTTPDGDQTAARVVLCPGDVLMACDDGGIDVSISDAVRRKRVEDQIRRTHEDAWWAYRNRTARKSALEKNPVWLIRNAQEAVLDRCVSYAKDSREPRLGPVRPRNTHLYSSQVIVRSEQHARQMVWC